MELIYADKNRVEMGILRDFNIDIDVSDKKDFEIEMSADNNILSHGYYWFSNGMEYGGVVDSVKTDTSSNIIKYYGRNLRGILESKVIEPPENEDYLVLSGTLPSIINEMLHLVNISDMFVCDTYNDDSENLEVYDYQVNRYITLYAAIMNLLNSENACLKMSYSSSDKKVHIKSELTEDYSDFINYCIDNSINFNTELIENSVNHLICLGGGELKNRNVIHLFTDENGEVQPYSLSEEPKEDSDYILDKSNQILIGLDENSLVYDYPNAETTENYILLENQPEDWIHNCTNYYYIDDNDNFSEVETTQEDVYTLITSKPSSWDKICVKYFTKTGGNYNQVIKETVDDGYKKLSKRPADWKKGYRNYYTYRHDGVQEYYETVSGVSKNYYKKQTKKPSDWQSEFTSYFRIKNKKYKNVEGTGKKKKTPPKWKKNKYYTGYTKTVTPKFVKNSVYRKLTKVITPSWATNTYYSKSIETIIPEFKGNTYYKKVLDHFAKIVEDGIKKLEELKISDVQEIVLSELEVDIGDTVGGVDYITGRNICEKVTNIIVKISDDDIITEYKIGGSN